MTTASNVRAVAASKVRAGTDHLLLGDGTSAIVTRVQLHPAEVVLTIGALLPQRRVYDRATILRVIRTQDAD